MKQSHNSGFFDTILHVLIALGLVSLTLFFAADSWFGAIGLRAFYFYGGIAVGVVCYLLIPFVIVYENMASRTRLYYGLFSLSILLILIISPLMLVFLIAGWFFGFIFGSLWLPIGVVLAAIGIVLVIQIALIFSKHPRTEAVKKGFTIVTLIFMSGYIIGCAAFPQVAQGKIIDRFTYGDHQYFLYIKFGGGDIPDDYLALYECNSAGLFCEVTYEAPSGYYRESQLAIVYDAGQDVVGAEIDGRFLPIEFSEENAAYLCEFFDVPSFVSFCTHSQFQNHYGFLQMMWYATPINYEEIVSFFERAGTFDAQACPPPEVVFADGSKESFTCRLRFPDKPYYLELYMSNRYGSVQYNVDLVSSGIFESD
ncbi:MAG: hypothetical protein K8L97_30820 [Anaerolineae bacterium]|nr:hypothetical protein [Anaerolineae bacterium]